MAYEAGTIIEGTVQYVANGQRCMNVVHYRPGTPGVGPIRNLVQGFLTVFQTTGLGTLIGGMKNLMSNDVVIDKVTAQAVFPTRYIKEETEEYSELGDIDERCNAQNVQMSWTKKGDLGNRHNIGSFHLGGLPDAIFKLGGWDEPTIAARIARMTDGLDWEPVDAANGITYFPVILNKTKVVVDGKVHYVISGATNLTSIVFRHELRVMRRRTVGLGI